MRTVDAELIRLLADMPFLDRLEMAVVSGWSRGTVYRAVRRLEDAGFLASVPHGAEMVSRTRRFCLAAAGIGELGRRQGADLEDALRNLPVSTRWRRILLERLDGVAVIYRLASAIADIAHPVGFRWYRAMPMDAAVTLPDGRTIGIVRQGSTTDRTGFSKRLWRLGQGRLPGVVLLLVPDEVRLRQASRLLARSRVPALFALESDVAASGPDDSVWRLGSVNAEVSLRNSVDRLVRKGTLPVERPLLRGVSLPPDMESYNRAGRVPDQMLPSLLTSAEKRALDLLSDWPWLGLRDLGALLGVSRPRASQIRAALEGLGLAVCPPASGRRTALTDMGLAVLARRDRASVGGARKRWSAAPTDADDWRMVSGRRSRQLLRNLVHTDAVHRFMASLARQARELGWGIAQLDPPLRASRYFWYFGGRRSIHPDAFGMLREDGVIWPFFLEWERRAVRPSTMAERLAPYLRYYSTPRPADDHGARPAVLIVFHERLAAVHFLRVALGEMVRTRTSLPLLVSHGGLLEDEGPLGSAWLAPGTGWKPQRPLPSVPRSGSRVGGLGR